MKNLVDKVKQHVQKNPNPLSITEVMTLIRYTVTISYQWFVPDNQTHEIIWEIFPMVSLQSDLICKSGHKGIYILLWTPNSLRDNMPIPYLPL